MHTQRLKRRQLAFLTIFRPNIFISCYTSVIAGRHTHIDRGSIGGFMLVPTFFFRMCFMLTNHELYQAVEAFSSKFPLMDLTDYLSRVAYNFARFKDQESITADELRSCLTEFEVTGNRISSEFTFPGYTNFGRALDLQIHDLEDMAANGSLRDPLRTLGLIAPSGSSWFNFCPTSFLTSGVAGYFGGAPSMNGDAPTGGKTIESLTWNDLMEFLWFCQNFEDAPGLHPAFAVGNQDRFLADFHSDCFNFQQLEANVA
jgi:hypothetical protein